MKKSVVLLALLAGLVGFAVVYQNSRNERMNSARLKGVAMREFLLPDLAVKDIRKIRVREGDQEVNLVVKGDRWVVMDRSDYPAAFDRINRAVEALAQTKINGKNEVGDSVLGKLLLLEPKEGVEESTTGLQVELSNDKGETLGSFVAGAFTQTTGGANSGNWMGGTELRYVRTPNDANTVWLTNNAFNDWSADPKQWLNKSFVTATDIMGVSVDGNDEASSWLAGRANPEDGFTIEGATADQKTEENVAAVLPNLLGGTVFSDVQPVSKAAELLKNPVTVTVSTFEGFTYQMKVAEKPVAEGQENEGPPSVYVTLKVAGNFPAERPRSPDEKPEDKEAHDNAFIELKKKAEERLAAEEKLENWVFEVPKSSFDVVFKKRSEVLVKKETEPQGGQQQQGGGIPGLPSGFQLPGLPSGGQ